MEAPDAAARVLGAVWPMMTATTTLTPRERQVATLLAYGYTNTAIADRLNISVRTAEMHRANAMRKLAADSRADVVRWALDHELLS